MPSASSIRSTVRPTALAAALVASALVSTPALAQMADTMEPAPAFRLGAAGGASFASGDYRDVTGNGTALQGSLALRPSWLPVGLRADVLASWLPDVEGGRFSDVGGFLNATLGPAGGSVRPYVIGGVGAVRHSPPEGHDDHGHDDDHGHAGEGGTETNFAWNAGGGLQFQLNRTTLFTEARFVDGGEGRRYIPIVIGILY